MNDWESTLAVRVYSIEPVLSRYTIIIKKERLFYEKIPFGLRRLYNISCVPVLLCRGVFAYFDRSLK